MGTRHLQTVIDKKGTKKVENYGQWDGYPEGQGIDILKFLRGADLDKYAKEVEKLQPITKKEVEKHDLFVKNLNKQNLSYDKSDKQYKEKYGFLSRDCGSDIHQLIQEGKVPFVRMANDGRTWCEGFYIIDLKEMVFKSEYHNKESVFNIANLPTDEDYLKAMEAE
jgi:hypothetical protein